MPKRIFLLQTLLAGILLTACAPLSTPTLTVTPTAVPPTATSQPTATNTPLPTATPQPTATPDPSAGFVFSSPLQDMALNELKDIVANPFDLPSPGYDDKHHGVDFAYYSRGSHTKMEGLEIYSVMPGKVAGVILNRKPYGNAIIIETDFSAITPAFLEKIKPPAQATPFPYNPRLVGCENLQTQSWTETPSAIYTLYGHMKDAPVLKVGDPVASGQLIGLVGTTGASVNPHLHLEMRWGPGGTEFASLSHYDTSATPAERVEYCKWRISGQYILINPMDVINAWLDLHQAPQ